MTGTKENVKFTSTSTALNKEADEIQQCCVSVYSICINPVIHHSLSQNKTIIYLSSFSIIYQCYSLLFKAYLTFLQDVPAWHSGPC